MSPHQTIQQAVDQLLHDAGRVVGNQSLGGGCISDAAKIEVEEASGSRRVLFAKSNASGFEDNFRCEWEGLVRLSEPNAIRVPEPLAVGLASGQSWLFLEWIEQGRRSSNYFELFGERLAQLHRATAGNRIGLDHDNYLGSARQINDASESWPEFVAEHRIGYQIRWATDQRLADASLRQDVEEIIRQMPALLQGREATTSLLHGDLWSGNYVADADGDPVILDPAIYYGCREAEFGMLKLFGGCPQDFYQAYQSEWPLPDGWQRRVNVYVLYHLLNHLNLFGSGYAGQCRGVAAEILRS